MRIGFDMQAIQTDFSRNRGIGRYSVNLIKNIFKIDCLNEYTLIYNNLFSVEDEKLFDFNKNVKSYSVSYLKNNDHYLNDIIQEFNYNYLNLDVLHILSPFETFDNKAIITKNLTKVYSHLVTTLYDLIPLIYSNHYLKNQQIKQYYYKSLKTLYDSDMILAISESSRRDAINLLGIPEDKIVNISGACSEIFHRIDQITGQDKDKILRKYGINSKFILYTGGIDFRKNIERTIEAFSKINASLLREYKLVIVCHIRKEDKDNLINLSKKFMIDDRVIFTGYIPDEDLNLLYNICDLFIFPSFYEGFGLPVIEAMKCGAPVIASNASSIPEIVDRSDCLFDPFNVDDIALNITKVLSNETLRKQLIKHCLKRANNFTWKKVAETTLDAYKNLKKDKPSKGGIFVSKPKIAYLSPLPPCRSGIADYSSELLPFLSKHFDIDIFVDNYEVSDNFIKLNFNIYNFKYFEEISLNKKYNFIIYQFGNSEFHEYMYDIFLKYPGIVVLHDFYLSGLIYNISLKRSGNMKFFFDEILYSHRDEGIKFIEKLQKKEIELEKIIYDLPINKRIINNALGIIVHSMWAKNSIFSYYPFFAYKTVCIINQHVPLVNIAKSEKLKIREKLGINQDTFVVSSFGLGAKTKSLDICIKLFSEFNKKHSNSAYIIVGDIFTDYKKILDDLIRKVNIQDKVIFTGYVDKKPYDNYLAISDVCLNLRYPTRGETSRSMLKSLGAGIPTIVYDDAYFSELPDNVVIKVPLGEENQIVEILDKISLDYGMKNVFSINALNYIKSKHSVEEAAKNYANALYDIQRRYSFVSIDGAVEFISSRLKESKIKDLNENQLDLIASQIFSMFVENKAEKHMHKS